MKGATRRDWTSDADGNHKQEGSTTNTYGWLFGTENTPAVGERGKGSGDGCWLLEGKNGIGGGGE